MERLLKGVKEFAKSHYEEHKELFVDLANGQDPHTLFIGCSDARLVSSLITSTLPGDLFIMRNIANIVPPYDMAQEHLSVVAAIEYAVEVLDIECIVICGHSNCGGCDVLDKSKTEMKELPHTYDWLDLARPAYRKIKDNISIKREAFKEEVERANIILQREHLLTYPMIKKAHEAGTLTIFGWYYNIEHGTVENYIAEKDRFETIE